MAYIYQYPPLLHTMAHMIVKTSDFDASQVSFSDLRKNKMGGKVVYISNPMNKKLVLQLPKMRAPFGLSRYDDQNSGKSTFSLDLSLDGRDDLRKKLEGVDDEITKLVSKNSKAWLGKQHSLAVVKDVLYKPIVKLPQDDKYAPTIKLKVMTGQDGNFIPEAYDHKGKQIDMNSIEKGQTMRAIVHISQIWIIDNKCGVSMRLEQVMTSPTDKIRGFAFQPDGEDDPVSEDEGEAEEELEEGEEYEDEIDDGDI